MYDVRMRFKQLFKLYLYSVLIDNYFANSAISLSIFVLIVSRSISAGCDAVCRFSIGDGGPILRKHSAGLAGILFRLSAETPPGADISLSWSGGVV